MPLQLLLFDFDGTLADSFQVIFAAGNHLAAKHGLRTWSQAEAQELRSLGAREVLRRSGIPARQLPQWMREMRRELRAEIPRLAPQPGLDPALRQLAAAGMSLGLVTSNSRENVELFLERNRWQELFTHLACSTLFGKSFHIRRLLRHAAIAPGAAGYVGDETRDIEAARKAGVQAIAVTWGFNDRSALEEAAPDHLLDHPAHLLTLIR